MRPETVDFVRRAPARMVAERTVDAEPEAVFDVLADTPSWARWFPAITRAVWTSPPPFGEGSTRTVNVGPTRVEERFIVWEPPHRYGFTFLRSNVPLAKAGVELVELESDGAGRTRVRYTMAVEPPAGIGLVLPALRPAIEAGLGQGLKGLEDEVRMRSSR